ncbi:P-loop NTPase [Elusimicrobiota bacterium]
MTTGTKAPKDLDARLKDNMARIARKILVLSNKGGVGKSSVATGMAAVLNGKGKSVGVLDADIHGPSMSKMMGQEGMMLTGDDRGMNALEVREGLLLVSMAALLPDQDHPVIWRGPMKMGVLKQFLAEARWGELDYLVIDVPPGTGDEPLSLCQLLPDLTGAVIVTTPQDIALLDARKCVGFLRQLKIPILGIVENMSGFKCPHCDKDIELFKSGGGARAAKDLGIDLLGTIPFDPNMVRAADDGKLFVEEHPDSEAARAMREVVESVLRRQGVS